jgi:hypothetical protein
MNEYIFYTAEGFTQAPNSEDVENLQILGLVKANNENNAFNSLLKENPWIKEKKFSIDSIVSKQILINKTDIIDVAKIFTKYSNESKDQREILKSVLLELGVDETDALLIAIEAGGSQCIVTKNYLRNLKIPNKIFYNVYKAIKYFYSEHC